MGPHPGPGLGGHACGGMGRGWRCRLINMSPFTQSYPQSFSLHLLGPLPFPSFFSPISVSLLPTEPVREHTGTERYSGTPGDRSAILCQGCCFFLLISSPSSPFSRQLTTTKFWVLLRVYYLTWLLRKSWGGEERTLSDGESGVLGTRPVSATDWLCGPGQVLLSGSMVPPGNQRHLSPCSRRSFRSDV